MKTNRSARLLAAAIFAMTAFSSANAAVINKAATGTDLTLGASWGGTAPGNLDTATWISTSLGAGLTLPSVKSWQGIVVTDALSDIGVTGTVALTLGTGGINASASAKNISLGMPITLGSSQIWNVNTAKTLTASGIVSGAGMALTKDGAGTLTLSGANTYTGKTTISAGTVSINTLANLSSTSALGAPTTAANGTIDLTGGLTYTGAATSSNRVINLTGSATLTNSGSGLLTLTGGVTGTGNLLIRGAQATTESGLLAYTGTLSRTDASVLTLSNAANSFGDVTISNGTISVNSIADASANSALGAGSTITLGQSGFNNTGTLQFTGASGGSSNRAITILSNTGNTNGGIIENTIAGQKLTLGGNVTIGGSGTTPSLQLIGFGNGEMSGNIAGTGLTVTKDGTGTWTLSGTNTYSGATTITGGVLQVDNTLAMQNSAVKINNLGTLRVRADATAAFTMASLATGTAGNSTIDVGALTPGNINRILTLPALNMSAGSTTLNITNSSADGYSAAIGAVNTGNTTSTINSTCESSFTSFTASGTNRNNTLTFSGAGKTTIGTINNQPASANTIAVTINKPGGEMVLTGTGSTYSGATTVSAGTLKLSGTITGAGAMSLASGTTLTGSGSAAGVVTAQTGARIAPGNSVGSMTYGGLILGANSILDLEFNTTPANDTIIVSNSGGLTINGGLVNLYAEGTSNPAALTTGTPYQLIQYTGAIGGGGVSVLGVANPVDGKGYAFGTSGGWVTLTATDGKSWVSGSTDDNWQTADNWSSPVAAGDVLVFGSGARLTPNNDFAVATAFAGIVFNSDAVDSFTLDGNALTLNGAVANNGSLTQTINLDMALAAGSGVFNTGAGNLAVGGVVSGSELVTKYGSGTLSLGGVNTYTGATTIFAGTLELAGSGQLNSGTYNAAIANFGTLLSNTSAAQTLGGIISGTGALVKSGSGTLTLGGANSYTGATTLNAGILQAGSTTALGAAANASLVFGASSTGTLQLNAFSNTIISLNTNATPGTPVIENGTAGTATLTVNNTTDSTFAGVLQNGAAGTLALIKNGTGLLTLSGATANTNNGLTTVSLGDLAFSKNANVVAIAGDLTLANTASDGTTTWATADGQFSGSSILTFTGTAGNARFNLRGTQQSLAGLNETNAKGVVQNSETIGGAPANSGNSVLTLGGTGTYAFNGYLRNSTGTLALTKTGIGTQTLSGAQITYTGATQVNQGRLIIKDTGTAYDSASTTITSVLEFNTSVVGNTQQLNANGMTISGTGTLEKTGAGNLLFGGNGLTVNISLASGALIDVKAGTLRNEYGAGNWTANLADMNIVGGAKVDVWDSNITVDGLTGTGNVNEGLSAGTSRSLTVGVDNQATATFDGTLTNTLGTLSLIKVGSGIQTLTGASTYSGTTTINSGKLQVNNTTGSGTGSGAVSVNSSATLGGTGTLSGVVTVQTGGRIAPGLVTPTSAVGMINTASLTLVGGSLLDFEFNGTPSNDKINVTISGGLTINGGAFNLVDEGTATPATLTTGTPYNLIQYTGAISGTGITALSVANPVDGKSYVFGTTAGTPNLVTLTVNDGKSWDSGDVDDDNWTSADNWAGDVAPVAGEALVFGTGARANPINDFAPNTSFAGIVFNASNTGAFTLTGAAIDLTGAVSNNGGPTNAINLNLVLQAGAGVFNTVDSNLGVGGNISGSEALTKSGTGILTLTGTNSYSGATNVAAGTLEIGGAGQLGSGTYAGTITNNATLLVNSTAGQALNGTISGTGTLTKSNSGTLTLGVANTYSGGTTITAGTVTLGTATSLGSAGLTMTGGTLDMNANSISLPSLAGTGGIITDNSAGTGTSLLTVNQTGGTSFGGVIQNGATQALALTKSGTGTLTLTGASLYTGATTLSGGTLALSGGNNRLPVATTVAFSAASTLNVGSTTQTLAGVTLGNNVTGTISGTGGTLNVTATDLLVGGTAYGTTQTLNMGALDNFTFTGTTFSVGPQIASTGTGGNERGYLTLAKSSNSITATTFDVGGQVQYAWSTDSNYEDAQVYLGQANTINANTVNIGQNGGTRSLLQFAAGLAANPTLTIRGTAGGTTRADMSLGKQWDVYTTPTSKVDLTAGVTGTSLLDAMIGTLDIQGYIGNNITADFIMGGGTLDATTIKVAHVTGGSHGNNFTGRFYLNGGGTVKVDTLTFNQDDGTGNAYGQFHLNSGTLAAKTIQPGAGSGKTFNWNDGTVKNYDASTDLTIASGITITLAATGTHTFDIGTGRKGTVNSVLGGAGGTLVKDGAGTLTLPVANTFSGGSTTVNNGTLVATNASALGVNSGLTVGGTGTVAYRPATAGQLNLGSGVLNLAAGSRIIAAVGGTESASAITSTGVAVAAGTHVVDIENIIASPAWGGYTHKLIDTPAGGLTAGGASFTLGTITLVNAYDFSLDPDSFGYDDTGVWIDVIDGGIGLENAYWKGGYSGGINVWAISNVTTSNWASDVDGTDTPMVPGPNSTVHFSADTAVQQDAMVLGHNMSVKGIAVDNNPGAVTLTADGYSLILGANGIAVANGSGALTLAAPVILASGQNWANDSSSNPITVTGVVSGAYGPTKTGAGVLSLAAANTHTGTTTASGGTLELAHLNALATSTLDTGTSGAQQVTFVVAGTNTYNLGNLQGADDLAIGGNTISVGAKNAAATFSGAISGTGGNLIKTGTGALTLDGTTSNTFTGLTTLSGTGQLILSKTGGAKAIGGDINMSATGTRAILSASQDNQFAAGSVMRFVGAQDTRFELKGTTQTLGGLNSTGQTAGSAFIQHSEFGIPAAVDATSLLILDVAEANAFTFAHSMRDHTGGTVALTKTGAGTQTLSGSGITYTGATAVTGGTLKLTNTTAFASAIANSAIVEFNVTSTVGLGSGVALSGAGTYNKTGSAVLGFNGTLAITATGQINIQEGTLQNNGNAVNWSGNKTDIDVTTGAILDLYADPIYLDALTGEGFVQNNYGNSSGQSGASIYIEKLVLGTNDGGGTFSGVIRNNATNTSLGFGAGKGGVQVEKTGTGTQTFSGTNSYTGITTFTDGVLSVATIGNGGVAGNLGAAAVAAGNLVFNGGTLQYTGATASTNRSFTINAGKTAGIDVTEAASTLTISGISTATNGALTKLGAGTLELTGANPHTGTTAVNAGTLLLTSPGAVAGPATVGNASGATGTLAGNGTVTGATDVLATGVLSPGNASVATLNFGSTLTLQSGSSYEATITSATTNDKVIAAGAMTANGTIKVTLSSYAPVLNDTFDLANDSDGAIAGTPTFDFTAAVLGSGLVWDTSTFATDGTIKVVAAASNTYADWAAGKGLTGDDALPGADPDNDGIPNAVEMVLGGHPKTGMDTALLPTIELVHVDGILPAIPEDDYLLFTYRRADQAVAANLGVDAEYDADLVPSWTVAVDVDGNANDTAGVQILVDDNWTGWDPSATVDTDRVRVYVPLGSNAGLFGRLNVVVPAP